MIFRIRCPECGGDRVQVDTRYPAQVVLGGGDDNIVDVPSHADQPELRPGDQARCEECDTEGPLLLFRKSRKR